MKILLAPDKFKGSLTASQVAQALSQGLQSPHIQLDLCPLADGGEGTVQALVTATQGTLHQATVIGPLPNQTLPATYGLLGASSPHTAILEMSAAAGLALLPPHHRNPLHTTTFGVGQLILHALRSGAKKIILGIGGSATVDGGVACAQACGAQILLQHQGHLTPLTRPFVGADLQHFHSISPITLPAAEILVACDVTNPLTGPHGAARIFAPQKGASPQTVEQLEQGLSRLAARTNPRLATLPGAGAAGGLGFGMLAFFHAHLQSGIEIVIDAVQLRDRLRTADLCITGEGRLDSQSLSGKAPVGVASACRDANVPCIAIVGRCDLTPEETRRAGFVAVHEIGIGLELDERIKRAHELITREAIELRNHWQP